MATIEGVTFNLSNVSFKTVPRNFSHSIPGYDSNPVTSMGYEGLSISVEGFEVDGDTYDEVVAAFLSNGRKVLSVRDGWKYDVYSVQHTITNGRGITDNYFPYSFDLITSEPYQHSINTNYRSVKITSDEQTWTAENMASTLALNWSFDSWNNGITSPPDHWAESGGAGSVVKSVAEYKHGNSSAVLTCTTDDYRVYQEYYVNNLEIGDEYSVGFWLKSATSSACRIYVMFRGGAAIEYNYTTETIGNTWTFVEATGTVVNSDQTYIQIQVTNYTDGTEVYVDCAILQKESEIDSSTFDRSITTTGTVDASPSIRVTANEGVGYGGTGTEDEETDAGGSTSSTSYVLMGTLTHTAVAGKALKLIETQYYHTGGSTLDSGASRHEIKVTVQATSYNGGVETTIRETSYYNGINSPTTTTNVEDVTVGHNEDLVVRIYTYDSGTSHSFYVVCDALKTTTEEQTLIILDGVQVFNTADPTVKCNLSGELHPDTQVQINTDGTGTYRYLDDMKTNKCLYDTYAYAGTYSTSGYFTMAVSGYLEYQFETFYPITGIPVLTALIDITAGTPTIQIAADSAGSAGTYYDIDDAIVDNVLTAYELDNVTNLSLKGKTVFWVRILCDASSTCVVHKQRLDLNIVTVDAEHPLISSGTNEFQCDQSSSAAISCAVDLIYKDRKWAR